MANDITEFVFQRMGVDRLRQYLDVASLRHKLLAGNVANVATAGYRSRDMDFDSEVKRLVSGDHHLQGALTSPNHLPVGRHPAKPPEVTQQRVPDGTLNSVDIDKEISTLATNELRFTTAAKLLQFKFAGLSKAIKGD